MMYWAVFVGGYLYTASKNELRKVSDKQFVESKYAATTSSSTDNSKSNSSKSKSESKQSNRQPSQNKPVYDKVKEESDDEEENDEEQGKPMDSKAWVEKQLTEQARRDALIKSFEVIYEGSNEVDPEKDKDIRSASETALTASVGESMI
jgi:flagellar biosynthesis GTPase FlhF